MQRIIIICGPTGVGKSAAAVALAKRFGGEIVSADSQSVWQGFDIGTAKPSAAERLAVSHQLIDVAGPSEKFDAARFVKLADAAIEGVAARGAVPLVVGGTGMYLRMLVHGICEAPPRDARVRRIIEKEVEERGVRELHEELRLIDPESALKISPGDTSRIVRALEIFRVTGAPASAVRGRHAFGGLRYDALKIGLEVERAELYRRIEERVDRMMEQGLVEEVRLLLERYDPSVQPFAAVGYKEIVAHLKGEYGLEDAVKLVKQHTRNLAKRQLTWFRADPDIRWFDPGDMDSIADLVKEFLIGSSPRTGS